MSSEQQDNKGVSALKSSAAGPIAPPLRSGPSDQGANVPDAPAHRHLRFRWWLTHGKDAKMFGPESIFQLTDTSDEQVWGSSFNPDHVVFMQFTGLLDKNGKEVYEGDIVRTDLSYVPVGVVMYHDEAARWILHDPNNFNETLMMVFPFEVIGNIHENPDLLK
jgi:hypothetical protein